MQNVTTHAMFLHFCRRWHPPGASATPTTVSRHCASAVQRLRPPLVLWHTLSPLPSHHHSCHLCSPSLQLSANRTVSEWQTLSLTSTRRLSAPPAINISLYYLQTDRHPFNGFFSGTTWVSWHQKGETILDSNKARDDGLAVASAGVLDHMQIICISLQTDNQATGYASQHIWCLSQASINWLVCGRKGIWCKIGGMMDVGH